MRQHYGALKDSENWSQLLGLKDTRCTFSESLNPRSVNPTYRPGGKREVCIRGKSTRGFLACGTVYRAQGRCAPAATLVTVDHADGGD